MEKRRQRERIIKKKFIKKDSVDERAGRMRLTETGDGNRNAEKFY